MIAINSTNLVSLTGHQDQTTGDYINNATVTASVRDTEGILFTVPLTYISASNGNYRGVISAAQAASLVQGDVYVVEYIATSIYGQMTDRNSELADYL